MTEESFGTKRLLVLRKLTRSIADLIREQVRDYVTTLTPLLRPRVALGDPADAGAKEPMQTADKAFRELQTLFEQVAAAAPFNLRKDLRPPVEVVSWGVELSPLEYIHVAKDGPTTKTVKVTAPLKWVLTYSGLAPGRLTHSGFAPRVLKDLLADRNRPIDEIRHFVLHYLMMHLAVSKQPGVAKLLGDLHLTAGSMKLPDFGELPLTYIASTLSTLRPPDDVLIEHTEIAGTDAFEEVVNVQDLAALHDPLRKKLLDLAKSHGADLPTPAA